jgi:hypothetical protein
MKLDKIKLFFSITSAIILFGLVQIVSASDTESKKSSGNKTALEKKGPIARATGLPSPLAEIIAAYRGPVANQYVYADLSYRPQWLDEGTWISEPENYFLENPDGTIDCCNIYTKSLTDHRAAYCTTLTSCAEKPYVKKTIESDNARKYSYINPQYLNSHEQQEIAQQLKKQKEITKAVLTCEGISLSHIDPIVAAAYYNGLVIATRKSRVLQIWPTIKDAATTPIEPDSDIMCRRNRNFFFNMTTNIAIIGVLSYGAYTAVWYSYFAAKSLAKNFA